MSSGATVRIPSTGLTFTLEQAKLSDDSIPVKEYTYELINTSPIDGAFEPEDIDKTKRDAPDFIRSGARAVIGSDYSFWVKKSGIGGIVDCVVYGEQEVGISVINANNVWATYLTQDGSSLSNSELQSLHSYMKTYKTVTTQLILQPAEVIPLAISVRVKRTAFVTAANSEIFDFIKSSMNNLFLLREGSLAKTVYHSDLVNYITKLQIIKDGIGKDITQYANIDVKALKKLEFPLSRTSDSIISIDAGVDGDNFIVSIDGRRYKQTWSGSDTTATVASELGARLALDEVVSTSVADNKITISLDQTTRVNEIPYSEDFTQNYYTLIASTVSTGALNGPSNTALNATKIEETTAFGAHGLDFITSAGPKTLSFYAISGERTSIQAYFTNITDGARSITTFNLTDGIVDSGTGTIESIANGWYRCTISTSASSMVDTASIRIVSSSATTYQGVLGEGVFIFGTQLVYDTIGSNYLSTNGTRREKAAESGPYTISFSGSTDISNIAITDTWQLPLSQFKNEDATNLFVPGAVELIKEDGTVLLTDNGAGVIGTGTIDYVTGEISLPLALDDGIYYFRYSQDQYNNFVANQRQSFSYYPPKTQYSDLTETLSVIEII